MKSQSRLLKACGFCLIFSIGCFTTPAKSADLAETQTKTLEVEQLPGSSYAGLLGAVATVHPEATTAAMRVLLKGGTAIDAAIAAALTLGVVDGFNSGIGGGLFATVRYADGTLAAIDGREAAPAAARADLFIRGGSPVKELSRTGALAIGIPGSVLAFELMHEAGGHIPLRDLYEAAAEVAARGFKISPHYADRLSRNADDLRRFQASRLIFLDSSGQPWPSGHLLKQPDLADTYRLIARNGSEWFYRGAFAETTARWMTQQGGIITKEDFSRYLVKSREPIRQQFGEFEIVSFPPPSSGGIHLAQMLKMLDHLNYAEQSQPVRQHLLAEVMKSAYADRSQWVGDPDFVDIPDALLSEAYLTSRADAINHQLTNDAVESGEFDAHPDYFKHTSHISVADAKGNWVSMTTSLNTSFGSKVTIPGTGVLMNNQMDDFAAQAGSANRYGLVQGQRNLIEPGKRPLSSMTPTLVLQAGVPVMSVGAAGGPMIINQVLQAISNRYLLKMTLGEALAAKRLHHQWRPNKLFVEATFDQEEMIHLADRGHVLDTLKFEGSTNAVGVVSDCEGRTHCFVAVSEPRMVKRNALD